jgi:lysophospholipase L1-like esterase
VKARYGIGVAAIAATVLCIRFVVLLQRGRRVARASRRFIRRVRRSDSRILVVGDSTAVGTGASAPAHTVAGRLSQLWPNTTIANLGRIGSRTADVSALLERLRRRVAGRRYALLIVHTGGNDTLHFTPARRLRVAIDRTMACALDVAERVVVITGGNLALAPGVFQPLAWMWGRRGRLVRALFVTRARQYGVLYVDLFNEAGHDPTEADPDRFFAADGLHPSDANYELWFREIVHALRARATRGSAP